MMRRPFAGPIALALSLAGNAAAGDGPTYERDVRPVLSRRCTVCHNAGKLGRPDVSGGLALDTLDAALKGTADRKVIEPGRPDSSELVRRLADPDEENRMPLGEDPLPDDQRDLIRRWIEAGAPRGDPADSPGAEPARPEPARRLLRTLDVALPTEAKAPKDVEGLGPGGAIEVVLKAGPLPAVTALSLRGDGRLLAVGTAGVVVLWDLFDATPVATLPGLPGPVHALAFSRDGRRLAVGSGLPARSGSVRVYSVPDGNLQHDFEGHADVVYAVAFRPDGAQLASAGFDQAVRLWDLADGRPSGVFGGHSDFVYDVAYAPDGRTLLSGGKDRSIKRFEAATAKGLRTYSDHDDDVLALAVRPDGSGFVSAGNEPQLRWWSFDGEQPARRVGGHGGPVHALAFSGDGRRLISAGGDKTVRLWDGATGAAQKSLPGPTEWQYAVALSTDGHLAAAGGWDGLVRVWDADAGKLLATLLQAPGANPSQTDWLAVAPGGFLAASPDLSSLLRWRIGGVEVPPDLPASALVRADQVASALRGQPTAPPAFPAKEAAK